MNYKIIPHPVFIKQAKRLFKKYQSFKTDLESLNNELTINPFAGTDLGGGVHKVRMAIASKNRGKSHGARVITFNYLIDEENGVLSLLTVYDKAEREAITKEEIARLIAEMFD